MWAHNAGFYPNCSNIRTGFHTIAGTQSGGTERLLYYDSNLVGSLTYNTFNSNSSVIYIGNSPDGALYLLRDAVIQSARVYNRVLTAGEIAQNAAVDEFRATYGNGNTAIAITLGGQPCDNPHWAGTDLVCETRAHTAGVVDIELDGVAHLELTETFTYVSPDFITLSVDKSDVNIGGTPNILHTDYAVANVITNILTGYHLDIEASEPDLICASDNAYRITAVNGPSGTLSNQWGYQLDDDGDEATVPSVWNWSGVTNLPVSFKTFPNATDPDDGDDTVLWFGTKFNLSIPACRYGGAVMISAITN
jgi:hypothetical protein